MYDNSGVTRRAARILSYNRRRRRRAAAHGKANIKKKNKTNTARAAAHGKAEKPLPPTPHPKKKRK